MRFQIFRVVAVGLTSLALAACGGGGGGHMVAYPSIVDHADTTVNFENAGRTPYLYYVRVNGDNLDRDVVRVPLTLTRTN